MQKVLRKASCAAAKYMLAALCASLLLSTQGKAETRYEYLGPLFTSISNDSPPAGEYTQLMRITGSFTTDEPLGDRVLSDISALVTSYSFYDGRVVHRYPRNMEDPVNSHIEGFEVEVINGEITEWQISLADRTADAVGEQNYFLSSLNDRYNQADEGQISECTNKDFGCWGWNHDRGSVYHTTPSDEWGWSIISEPDLNAEWYASEGTLPDLSCPAWMYKGRYESAPDLSTGVLVLDTSAGNSAWSYYQQSGLPLRSGFQNPPTISIPETLIIEARLRFVSGSTSYPRTRTHLAVGFEVVPTNKKNALFIDHDGIFLLANDQVPGPFAALDTSEFHTYRIKVRKSTGEIIVYVDGTPVLVGSTYGHSNSSHTENIWFGDGTSGSRGVSEIEFVRHNASIVDCGPEPDSDGDGVPDINDNCPDDSNPEQTDTDLDGLGDACDTDIDGDTVLNVDDNCQFSFNPEQTDTDLDGSGDVCDADIDGDTVQNTEDNCPSVPNPYQDDTDTDSQGDACDEDDDNDGVCDIDLAGASCTAGPDNCPTTPNPEQADLDGDGIGDVCDADLDGDGVDNTVDNCPVNTNTSQDDTDFDGDGDACDLDDDDDGVFDVNDNCPLISNPQQYDLDGDGRGDMCDADIDGDGIGNTTDNCPSTPNAHQHDFDGDSAGDACDADIDGDDVPNVADVCEFTPMGNNVDPATGCSIDQLAPCAGPRGQSLPWKNHGKYVSSLTHAANQFRKAGLISDFEHGSIISEAAQSGCGD